MKEIDDAATRSIMRMEKMLEESSKRNRVHENVLIIVLGTFCASTILLCFFYLLNLIVTKG